MDRPRKGKKNPTKSKKQKLQNKLKIVISRSDIKIFENKTECDDLSSRGSLIPKISLLSQKLLPKRPILRPNSIFQQNRKFSKFLKMGYRYSLSILQSPYMPNFKSLSCFVRSTGAFIFNRE